VSAKTDAYLLSHMTDAQKERAAVVAGLSALATADEDRMRWVICQFAARAVFDDETYMLLAKAATEPTPS
jgi:hypothetical protein